MAEMWANVKLTDSLTADYWALHLRMETRWGLKMVDQIY